MSWSGSRIKQAAPPRIESLLMIQLFSGKQLESPSGKATNRPRELDTADLANPVARILTRLHNDFVFDIDELDSIKHAERANELDPPDVEAGDFWERLAREELEADPRVGAYRRLGARTPFDEDPVLLLLRMMLDRTPRGDASTQERRRQR